MKVTQAHYEAPKGHVVLTGPISGTVELEDGTVYDVTPGAVEIDPAHADEVSFLIGEHWVQHGHPDDVETLDDGSKVQRPFEHQHPEKFDNHSSKFAGRPAGKKV